MGEIKVKEKEIVVPGQLLATGMEFFPSQRTYRAGEDIRAEGVGIVKIEGKVLKLTPLSGIYMPKKFDVIIAQVIDVLMSGWRFDINSAYSAMLPLKDASTRYIEKGADLTKIYALGDCMSCKITNVTSQKLVDVSMKGPGLRKLTGGRIIEVNTNKVPRIIGKQGSMVSMIKDLTGCRIVVGQNGLVWVDGVAENEVIAVNAITKIEEEAHLAGLTDRIKKFLEDEMAKTGKPFTKENRDEPSEESSGYSEGGGRYSREEGSRYGHEGGGRYSREGGARYSREGGSRYSQR